MKWETDNDYVGLIADTAEDRILLRQLYDLLPIDACISADNGTLELLEGPSPSEMMLVFYI